MARENGEAYETDASVIRETITAAVQALAEGKIKPTELPIAPHTKSQHVRYAPSYSSTGAAPVDAHPYTIEGLAKFLGEVDKRGEPRDTFKTVFGMLELLSDGHLTEAAREEAQGQNRLRCYGVRYWHSLPW